MALKRFGLQALNIAKLILPGDISTRRRNEKVIRLGKSFAATGGAPVNPPVVEKGTWKLLSGADRVSACLNENIPRIECLVVSGSASELEEVTLIENAMRRHSASEQDAAIARLVKIHQSRDQEEEFPEVEEEREEPESEATPEPAKKTHPNKAKSEAIAKVAEATGKTHKAVKSSLYREKKAAEAKPGIPASTPAEEPELVIDSMGLDVPADIRKQTALEHAGLSAMHRELVTLQGKLTRLEGEVGHQYQALKGSLHDAAVAAKNALPASVCAWCKLTSRRKGCPGCKGKGWLTVGEMKAVTDERLLATGKGAGIWVDSEFVKLEKVA
jgi:ParB-like chromosome segregation protein Spo0J